jgi:hypothetical protein
MDSSFCKDESPENKTHHQAKIWVGILEENEELNHLAQKLRRVGIKIEEMKTKKTQEVK